MGRKSLRTTPRIKEGHIFESIFDVKLWEETTSYNYSTILQNIKDFCDESNAKYICVYHDADTKPHYHVTVRFDNPRYLDIFAYRIGLEDFEQDISWKSDFRLSVRYLFHIDNSDKYRYFDDSVVCSNFDFACYINDLDESQQASLIVQFILDNHINRLDQVLPFVFENNLYPAFRRGYLIFKELIRKYA